MKIAVLLLAFAIGCAQFCLLAALLKAALGGNLKRALPLLGAKLVLYGGSAALLALAFRAYLLWAAIGYGAAVPLCLLVYYLFFNRKGGTADDTPANR